MKVFLLILTFFSVFLRLEADMLTLKSGEVYVGRYVSDENDAIQFEIENNEVKSFPKTIIKKFELGYSGMPVCFKRADKWAEECDRILHQIDDKRAILGTGKGLLKKEEIQLSNLKYIKVVRTNPKEKLITVLRPGSEIEIEVNGKQQRVKIKKVKPDSLEVENESGKTEQIADSKINGYTWKPADERVVVQRTPFYKYLVPGWIEYEHKKWKGILVFTLFVGFAAAIPVEYNAAAEAANNNVTYIPVNGNLFIIRNLFPSAEYNADIRNMNYAIGGLAMVLSYHSYEVYSHITAQRLKTSINLKYTQPYDHLLGGTTPGMGGGYPRANTIELKFTYSF